MKNCILFSLFLLFILQSCEEEEIINTIFMEKQHSGIDNELISVFFPSTTVGYAGGVNGVILRTNDAGLNWEKVSINSSQDIIGILFSGNDTGIVVTGSYPFHGWNFGIPFQGSVVYYTYNKAESWTKATTTSFPADINQLFITYKKQHPHPYSYYVTPDLGFEVAADDGTNYQGDVKKIVENQYTNQWGYYTGSTNYMYGVHFYDENNGFAVGVQSISQSKNGGLNWTWLRDQNGENLFKFNGVFCLTENSGFAVGPSGSIVKFYY